MTKSTLVGIGLLLITGCNSNSKTENSGKTKTDHIAKADTIVSNHWGKAITKKLDLEEFEVFSGKANFAYNHHPQITSYKNKLLATWSSGIYNEDEPGQKMLLSFSEDDGETWSNPVALFDVKKGKYNDLVHTAEGILPYRDTLFAFCGVNDYQGPLEIKQDVIFPEGAAEGKLPYQLIGTDEHRTEIKFSVDGGISWSPSKVILKNFIPNLKPVLTASGRLIIPGNMSFPYTDGSPLNSNWKIMPVSGLPEHFIDAPRWFRITQEEVGAAFKFCEASIFQTDDGILKAMLRTDQGRLAITESRDNGESWSFPSLTNFTDTGNRFEFGRLPDGRYFGLTCPEPRSVRTPLVLALSKDGINFDQHYVLGDEEATTARISGRWKYGRYGYASYRIKGDKMYVIYSNNKEDITMVKFMLHELS